MSVKEKFINESTLNGTSKKRVGITIKDGAITQDKLDSVSKTVDSVTDLPNPVSSRAVYLLSEELYASINAILVKLDDIERRLGPSWYDNGDGTVSTFGELNQDYTFTTEGTLNLDGTFTVTTHDY